MKPGLVSIVIVTWNAAGLLRDCLAGIDGQTYPSLEVIAVDNASSDATVAQLREHPHVRLIENARNLGFVISCNRGIESSEGEYVLLLNADVTLDPEYVSRLVAALQPDGKRGSATGKLYRPGRRLLDSTGHRMFRCVWAVNRGQEDSDRPEYDVAGEVFGVSGAAALHRRQMLDDIAVEGEFLDSTFFMYLDDVDIDWRARLRGWSSWYVPDATAVHHRGASGARVSAAGQRHIFKNRLLMILKNDAGWEAVRRAPAVAAFTAAKAAQLLRNHPRALLGTFDFLRLASTALAKRRQIQSRRIVSPAELEAWFEPLPIRRLLLRSAAF
jgi:GT2 family glycosyltransferase